MGRYVRTRTFSHGENFKCTWRNWRSSDSTRFLHGHSLQVKLIFDCTDRDDSLQVMDVSRLDEIHAWLNSIFNNTTIIAADDPELTTFQELHSKGLVDLRVIPHVGYENFAEYIWKRVARFLGVHNLAPRVLIRTVEVIDGGSNSALYVE